MEEGGAGTAQGRDRKGRARTVDPTWEEVLKKRRQFFEEFKGHLLRVDGPVREIFKRQV